MEKFKYPRTFHLPYSPSVSDDDKMLKTDEQFYGMNVVVTEKMDGENTTVYPNGCIHARSIDGNHNPWQDWLKSYIWNWCYKIPDGYRVCGENLYPRHSISYSFPDETFFFQAFSIYDNNNICLSWDDTVEMCNSFGIRTVPKIFHGIYSKSNILDSFVNYSSENEIEGFVVRNSNSFNYSEFNLNVAKFVRKNHVTTDEHWSQHWTQNEILKNECQN